MDEKMIFFSSAVPDHHSYPCMYMQVHIHIIFLFKNLYMGAQNLSVLQQLSGSVEHHELNQANTKEKY